LLLPPVFGTQQKMQKNELRETSKEYQVVSKPDTSKPLYKVRLQPTGNEFDVYEGETVLNAGFRQGVALLHGCKEGQCSSCKAVLLEGDHELLKYSTFALPDSERDANKILLCRTLAYSYI
jgi:propane monooxygenase reductase subunit